MSVCNQTLMAQGKQYPRTCAVHGLRCGEAWRAQAAGGVTVVGKDPDALKRVTCRSCAAVLQYTLSDVKRIDGRDIYGGPDGCEYVDCPCCSGRAVIRSW